MIVIANTLCLYYCGETCKNIEGLIVTWLCRSNHMFCMHVANCVVSALHLKPHVDFVFLFEEGLGGKTVFQKSVKNSNHS